MIQGGEHQVNRGGLDLALLLEMAFEIADGVIARVRIAERVAIFVGAGFEIGAILPDLSPGRSDVCSRLKAAWPASVDSRS